MSEAEWEFVCMEPGPRFHRENDFVDTFCALDRGHGGWHQWSADDSYVNLYWADDWSEEGLTHGAWRDR